MSNIAIVCTHQKEFAKNTEKSLHSNLATIVLFIWFISRLTIFFLVDTQEIQ